MTGEGGGHFGQNSQKLHENYKFNIFRADLEQISASGTDFFNMKRQEQKIKGEKTAANSLIAFNNILRHGHYKM